MKNNLKSARPLRFLALPCMIWLAFGLSGCGNLEFPGVYKIKIEQGNIVTQEMVDQLEPGMTRDQVAYIMGSPIVQDSFNGDRWDYVYSVKDGHQDREQHRLTLFFKDDQLSGFSGDFLPSSAALPTGEAEAE